MPAPRTTLEPGSRLIVLAAGLGALAVSWWLSFGGPTAQSSPHEAALAALVFGTLAAAYGSRSGRGLGLGAVCLPPLLHFWGGRGTAPAVVILLAVAYLTARKRRKFPRRTHGRSLVRWAEVIGVRLLAVIAAGAVWRVFYLMSEPLDGIRFGATSGLIYFAIVGAAEIIRWATAGRAPQDGSFLQDTIYEMGAWSVGVLSVLVFTGTGRGAGIFLLGAVAVLALELTHLDRERSLASEGARRMREVHLAGHRIIFGDPEPLSIARQIVAECRGVVRFSWLHLVLPQPDQSESHWFAGPDGVVREGKPDPAQAPPVLPGIHRRAKWVILERELAVPDRRLGRIKFWCDPRRLESDADGWLDTLLPEIVSAVHGALLDREAREDPLTGLAERRSLEQKLQHAYMQSVDFGLPMAVIMSDLDHFKRVNDLYGHATGDEALKAVANVLETHRREKDTCCRYGGEEFAVVLEETDGDTALQVAERLRVAVEDLIFAPHGKPIPLRLSLGVAAFPELHATEGGQLLEMADEALYFAKSSGRNRCLQALGRGVFRTVGGEELAREEEVSEQEIPTLFA